MKTFFVTLPREIDIRNFILGDFYTLAKNNPDMRLVIFVAPERLAHYRSIFSHERCMLEPFPGLHPEKMPMRQFFSLISYASLPTATIQFRQKMAYLNGGSLGAFLGKKILWRLGHFGVWRVFLRALDFVLIHDDRLWDPYFQKYQPCAVLAPGLTDEKDLSILRYARQKRIPAVGMPRSWDNLTSKLILRVFPDVLLVQNPSMAGEAQSLGDFPARRIRVVGFPQFDHYLDPGWRMSREELAQRFGLDPLRRWVIYFTGGLASSLLGKNDYSDHVEMLMNASERGEFGNAQIVVRVHPSDKNVLKGKAARAPALDFGQDFNFGTEDLKLLSNIVRESAVTVNTGSTMTLEAAIFDRPIVLAAFDGYDEKKLLWQKKLSVALDHTLHYQDLERTGGMARANDESELVAKVRMYLENPKLHQEGRMRLREQFVGPLDGQAGQKIWEHLRALS
ncbi:MAG: hypothetical protein HYW91_03480 [Candidatus Sungbacteria bacterium]|nr:hypothetical protein [Candidatus Sungbacteria bacterium]